jgi:hypothetical protein
MALIRETRAERHLGQAELAPCPQEVLRSFNAARYHILVRRQSGSCLELPREMKGAEMDDGRLQCLPFKPITGLQTGECDKLLGRLNSFENVFVLSNHRYKPCRPKACNHLDDLFTIYCPNGQPFLLLIGNVRIAQMSDRAR